MFTVSSFHTMQWARDLGQMSAIPVRVPLHPCEHYYLVTKPFEAVPNNMPGMLQLGFSTVNGSSNLFSQ
jgi:hypothetical protein